MAMAPALMVRARRAGRADRMSAYAAAALEGKGKLETQASTFPSGRLDSA